MQQADHQQVQGLQESAGLPPPWSSAGTTQDGFVKPEVYGPGRFITADLAPDSAYATACATCVVGGQYITASGTSLAAPIVAGAAADLLGEHPHWTPEMVKGALMHTDHGLPGYPGSSAGLVDANAASGADAHKTSSDANLIPSSLVVSSDAGDVSGDRSSWSRSSWSTAVGALRAPWARSSWSCTCSPSGGWAVGSTRSSWSSLTWTVDFGDVASPS
jgi:serine protease AprX